MIPFEFWFVGPLTAFTMFWFGLWALIPLAVWRAHVVVRNERRGGALHERRARLAADARRPRPVWERRA